MTSGYQSRGQKSQLEQSETIQASVDGKAKRIFAFPDEDSVWSVDLSLFRQVPVVGEMWIRG